MEQKFIRERVIEKNDFKWDINTLDLVAGVDISASKEDPDVACSALIVYSCKSKKIVYEQIDIVQINQPYIPGFLAFREVPVLYELFQKLKIKRPDCWP